LPEAVQVSVVRANVRAAASVSGGVLFQVSQDETLTVVNASGEWFFVETATGLRGYVHSSVVRPRGGPDSGREVLTNSDSEVITNEDVIAMAKAGLGNDIIITSIRQAASTDFDVSPSGLIQLKQAGVGEVILEAILRTESAAQLTQPPSQVDDSKQLDVNVALSLQQTSTEALTGEQAGIYFRASEGLIPVEPAVFSGQRTGGFFSGLTALVPRGRRAALRSPRAQLRVPTSTPELYFYFENAGAGLSNTGPGMFTGFMNGASSPNEFVLVKMEQKKNQREVDLGRDWIFGSRGGVNFDDVVDIIFERLQTGVYRVTPATPLEPGGEYAFFYAAGAGVVQEQGTGKLFDFGFDGNETP